MANITFSITAAKLQFAIAYIEGMKQVNNKITDVVIGKALADLGYTPIEIYLIQSTASTEVVEAVFNPPIHHRAKSNRKPKAEVQTTLIDDDADEEIFFDEDDDNVLGV